MTSPRFLLFAVLALKFFSKVSAMDCNVAGLSISCPGIFDQSKSFCCKIGSTSLEMCCDANDFLKQNPGILAGIIVGVLVFLIIVTLLCCCFCSCCCLAQRRMNRGGVVYVVR
ncbi:unnamed protein product [Larinioides sclopetarius]